MTTVHTPRELKEISRRGKEFKEFFEKFDPELQKFHGKFMAIEVDSGDCFIGATIIEAHTKARAQHPGKIFYLSRVGYRATIQYHGYVPLGRYR